VLVVELQIVSSQDSLNQMIDFQFNRQNHLLFALVFFGSLKIFQFEIGSIRSFIHVISLVKDDRDACFSRTPCFLSEKEIATYLPKHYTHFKDKDIFAS